MPAFRMSLKLDFLALFTAQNVRRDCRRPVKRVFAAELRGATATGCQSSVIALDVVGDGQPVQIYSYAWESGVHRSDIAVLDLLTTDGKPSVLSPVNFSMSDYVLSENSKHKVEVQVGTSLAGHVSAHRRKAFWNRNSDSLNVYQAVCGTTFDKQTGHIKFSRMTSSAIRQRRRTSSRRFRFTSIASGSHQRGSRRSCIKQC
jgi:hypothetical protein